MKPVVTIEVHTHLVCGHFEADIIKAQNENGGLEVKQVNFYHNGKSMGETKLGEVEGLYGILRYMRVEGIF